MCRGLHRYKVGYSSKNDVSRIKDYGNGTEIYYTIGHIPNAQQVESELIKAFGKRFSVGCGREYFDGDIEEMKTLFLLTVELWKEKPRTTNTQFSKLNDKLVMCNVCQKHLSKRSVNRHSCRGAPRNTCVFCKRQFNHSSNLATHKKRCKQNPTSENNKGINNGVINNDGIIYNIVCPTGGSLILGPNQTPDRPDHDLTTT